MKGTIWLIAALLGSVTKGIVGSQRPIYNLGHMVNAVKQVHSFIDDGANALETDVTFNKYGVAEYTYHGVPCDCFRDCLRWEYFGTFLDYISDVSTPGNSKYRDSYVLQFFDLKINSFSWDIKQKGMRDIAGKLITNFYKNGRRENRLKFIFSLPKSGDADLAKEVYQAFDNAGLGHLKANFGFDVYSYEDLYTIKHKWHSGGHTDNIWQGDGITNCLPRSTARLIQSIKMRDSSSDSFMTKVYYWTVDKRSTMRYALDVGVDGIMTNHPARLKEILQENGVRNRFRMASHNDNPFETMKSPSIYAKLLLPEILDNVEDDEVPETKENYDPLPIS